MIITVYMMDEVKNDYHCIHDGWSKEWLSLYTWWMKKRMIITVYMMDEVKNDYHCIHDGWSKEWLSLYTWWMK
jgi:hypothetical protein